ncbi:putative 4-carboxymuconolactone decarboxylase domain protein [Mycobacterium xenopi 3993]|nr:putative 4-carboxymuconolactone decarboxylase domain protein [Mycobacterium xenopi 3993]
MTKPRVRRLPVDEAKAAADEAGVPNYMAELAIFQVLLNHPLLAGPSTTCWRACCGTAALIRGCANW